MALLQRNVTLYLQLLFQDCSCHFLHTLGLICVGKNALVSLFKLLGEKEQLFNLEGSLSSFSQRSITYCKSLRNFISAEIFRVLYICFERLQHFLITETNQTKEYLNVIKSVLIVYITFTVFMATNINKFWSIYLCSLDLHTILCVTCYTQ